MAGTAVKLSSDILAEADRYARVFSRSLPKQIEHWARIGKIAEENPDLSYEFIKDILLALEEAKTGAVSEYRFG
ncbi:hypothetical protein AGMMS49940_20840 [Spirochaetia bacterium]|nr:hypothetical protein AGMMS49940_20840 [Spirochaetia bacterium]